MFLDIDLNDVPLPDSDMQTFEHQKTKPSKMVHIDLNDTPLPDNDMQTSEHHVNPTELSTLEPTNHTVQHSKNNISHMQEAATTKSTTQGIRHTFDLNSSPLSNNIDQPFEVTSVQPSSISCLSRTIPCEIANESIMLQGSKSFINVSLFEEAQEKTHTPVQGRCNFDLNALPSFADDAQSFDDSIYYTQKSSRTTTVSHKRSHEVMSETSTAFSLENILGALPPLDHLPCSSHG